MIGLDTNVLVRYIIQDDTKQAAKATALVEGLTSEEPGFISCIVLCELNWVLKSAYQVEKAQSISVIKKILSAAVFEIENLDCCMKALRAYEAGRADFSDYIIRELAIKAGCSAVVTFDNVALVSEGFESP